MKSLVFNTLLILLILGGVYLATIYSSPLRKTISISKSAVAGISTSSDSVENPLPMALKEDAKNQLEKVKEKALDVKVGEIFSFFSQAGKIIDDFHYLQSNLGKKIEEVKL